jgi:hypothetical protein
MIAAVWAFILQTSLPIGSPDFLCQGLFQLAISHQWAWVPEWQGRSIEVLCAMIIFLSTSVRMGSELYKVCDNYNKVVDVLNILFQRPFLQKKMFISMKTLSQVS